MVNVRDELNSAIEHLSDLIQDKERIEIEIAKQRKKVAAWQELNAVDSDDDAPSKLEMFAELLDLGGLTDAIKTVLRSSKKTWMLVSEIQEELRALGFPLDKYKAPYASIATTVNRMAEPGGEVVADRNASPGARQYKWVGPISYEKMLGDYVAPNAVARTSMPAPLPEDATNLLEGQRKAQAIREIVKAQGKLKKS